MNKGRELFILTQAGCLPFSVVKTEGEATEICAMLRRSNDPYFIHVIEYQAYKTALQTLKEISLSTQFIHCYGDVPTESAKKALETLKELGEHE